MNVMTSNDDEFEIDNMTREEFMEERREMGLDVDPQADDSEEDYQDGYTNSCTFNFILECDREIFQDFQEWALPLLNATTIAEEEIQQAFLQHLDLDSSCYFSDIEIFNIWFYKTNRVVYWICKDHDKFNLIAENFPSFEERLDAMLNPTPVIPLFIYGNTGITIQIFHIKSPYLGVSESIENHSVWYNEENCETNNGHVFLDQGDDAVSDEDCSDDEEISNWDMNNQDITIND